jgi:hypothetical protein
MANVRLLLLLIFAVLPSNAFAECYDPNELPCDTLLSGTEEGTGVPYFVTPGDGLLFAVYHKPEVINIDGTVTPGEMIAFEMPLGAQAQTFVRLDYTKCFGNRIRQGAVNDTSGLKPSGDHCGQEQEYKGYRFTYQAPNVIGVATELRVNIKTGAACGDPALGTIRCDI